MLELPQSGFCRTWAWCSNLAACSLSLRSQQRLFELACRDYFSNRPSCVKFGFLWPGRNVCFPATPMTRLHLTRFVGLGSLHFTLILLSRNKEPPFNTIQYRHLVQTSACLHSFVCVCGVNQTEIERLQSTALPLGLAFLGWSLGGVECSCAIEVCS